MLKTGTFKRYDTPKKGVFAVHTGEYKEGWVNAEQEFTIIGEDSISYVHRTQPLTYEIWERYTLVKKTLEIPIGIHKARLVRWIEA